MSGKKIFYRQRVKTSEGAQRPRFRVIAVSGVDLKVYGSHLRKTELKQLAKETKADLVELKRDKGSKAFK
jgi:hypothetical protein